MTSIQFGNHMPNIDTTKGLRPTHRAGLRIRNWLILKLAGRRTVIVNADICGKHGITIDAEDGSLLVNDSLHHFPDHVLTLNNCTNSEINGLVKHQSNELGTYQQDHQHAHLLDAYGKIIICVIIIALILIVLEFISWTNPK